MNPVRYPFEFTSKKLSDFHIPVVNNTTRTWLRGEFIYVAPFVGNVVELDGIAPGASGHMDTNPLRTFSTSQIAPTDLFTPGDVGIFFVPQTDAAPGYFRSVTQLNAVIFTARVIAASLPPHGPGNQYLEVKPPYQDGVPRYASASIP